MLIYLQNFRPYKERRSPAKERNLMLTAHAPSQTHAQSNGLDVAPEDPSTSSESRHELSQAEYPVLGSGKSESSDYHQSNLSAWESFHANTSSCPSEKLDFKSSCPQMAQAGPLPKRVNPSDYDTLHHQGSALIPVASATQNSQPLSAIDQTR